MIGRLLIDLFIIRSSDLNVKSVYIDLHLMVKIPFRVAAIPEQKCFLGC